MILPQSLKRNSVPDLIAKASAKFEGLSILLKSNDFEMPKIKEKNSGKKINIKFVTKTYTEVSCPRSFYTTFSNCHVNRMHAILM